MFMKYGSLSSKIKNKQDAIQAKNVLIFMGCSRRCFHDNKKTYFEHISFKQMLQKHVWKNILNNYIYL